ncbi:MAG TPA: LpqB family beta-propeller domain-containing protein [Vicinamibacterales bacterium]|nr:LpqB family beta-propeller domain-containing protein [Vicinamibacterales bacterium]
MNVEGGGRKIAALLVVLAAVAAFWWTGRRAAGPSAAPARLTWVATASQLGPVGYRDPAGAISPDGRWIAYSQGRFLIVRPLGGGPSAAFPPAEAQIRYLAWSPDSRTILADGYQAPGGWALYDREHGTRRPWPSAAQPADLRQPAWSADGESIAAVAIGQEGPELRVLAVSGDTRRSDRAGGPLASPTWAPGGAIACIVTGHGRSRITLPCGGAALQASPDADAYGPLAFSPDGATIYAAFANAGGTVDLWSVPVNGGRARQLTAFSRDSYAPSVAADGSIVFKVQSYRTHVAAVAAAGGPVRPLATFQSETPSWDPTGRWLGVTYGTWRRIPDDAKYPDIAQDTGIIAFDPDRPAAHVTRVVHDSASEDQSLCWSPNGRWIAFHSHKDQSDDVWLRPADGDAAPVRISFLGRGAETGWPRWSSDGRWLVFTATNRATHRTAAYLAGLDQESGAVTRPPQPVEISGVTGNVAHVEWLGLDRFAAINEEGPGRQVIYTVGRDGGGATVVHRFASEHHEPGLAVSPDGREVAFVAPAADGFYQLFRLPLSGGTPVQVTDDPSNKTQPAWSPDGRTIAFTVWSYEAQFWMMHP